jgi:hypothetical protein
MEATADAIAVLMLVYQNPLAASIIAEDFNKCLHQF